MAKQGFAAMCVLLVCSGNLAHSKQKQGEPIRLGINLVTLDVAVTDKHRRPVNNLTSKDFTVLEDGQPQKIESFSAGTATPKRAEPRGEKDKRSSESRRQAPEPSSRDTAHRFSGYRFTSIAIDSSVEGQNRDAIERAITRYVREQVQSEDLVAIYSLGNALAVVQPFTGDQDRLLKAAGRAIRGQLGTETAATRDAAEKEVERAARSEDPGSQLDQADRASRAISESYNDVSDYFQAQSLFRSLRAIIEVQRQLVGSKSLILFSQGATLAPATGYAVDGVISAANAAGVAIYVIDASGLSVGEAPHGIDPRGNIGMPSRKRPDIYGGEDPTDVRDGENGLERALKRSLASAQPDRIGALSRLSNQTGGIAITNNNDLAGALESIDADARSHYTITYQPRNQDFDGRFREITVKLENPDFTVRTRRGYHAVKSEAAITEDLPVRKLASDVVAGITPQFDLGMAASYFPRGQTAYLVPVTVKIPAGAISTQKRGDRYYVDLDFVIAVKDPSGAVVSTFGRTYPLELNEDQNKQLGNAGLPIRHNVRLAPGTYIITTALRDRASGRTAVARRGIMLPPVTDASRLSSLVLAQQTEQLPADYPAAQLARDVLVFGRNRVVMPTDSRFAAEQPLLLFFRVYPGTASFAHPALVVGAGFFKDGKLVQRTPAVRLTQSPASRDSGFPMATPLKLADLAPGEYTLRVELIDEGTGQHEIKEARFTLVK